VRVFDSGNSVSNRHGKDFLLLLFMYVNGPVFVLGVLGEVSSLFFMEVVCFKVSIHLQIL